MRPAPPADHRQAVLAALAQRTAERLGNAPGLLPLLRRSILPWREPSSSTPFGFGVSADGRDAGRMRAVVTPASDCAPEELRTLLGTFGTPGADASRLIDALGEGTGFERDGAEIGIGFDGPFLRVYVYPSPGAPAAGRPVEDYARMGWAPRERGAGFDRALEELPGQTIAFARRFGGRSAYAVYLVATAPLTGVKMYERADVRRFAENCGGIELFQPGRYGWQLGLDERGEWRDTKLYLMDPLGTPAEWTIAAPELAPFLDWCEATARAVGSAAAVSCAGLRVLDAGSSVTAYVNFLWEAPEKSRSSD